MALSRTEDGRVLDVNDRWLELTGFRREEVIGKTADELGLWKNSDDRTAMALEAQQGAVRDRECVCLRKNGQEWTALFAAQIITARGERVLISSAIDITKRRRAEEELRHLNRSLRVLGNSNRALIHAQAEAELLDEVCRIIVNDCGYAMVWIGFAQDDEARTVLPVAAAGFEAGYLETLRITWADTGRGHGPTGTAIRTGRPSQCTEMLTDERFAPWRAEALERGYASSLVLPLLGDGRAFGAVTIYSRLPGGFPENEVKLLRGYPGIHEHRNILLYQEVRRIHSRRSMHPCVSPTPPT